MTHLTLAAAWEAWDPALIAARIAQARELAALILAAPPGARAGDLVVSSGGWNAADEARADAAGQPGTPEWRAALGPHRHATLSADGREVLRTWCACPGGAKLTGWIRYERWAGDGRTSHGFACPSCRGITQTG